jgi:glycosyltransferase involved in cell wall biosynthesis
MAWRLTGRPVPLAKFAFWLHVLSEQFDKAQGIVTHHARSGQPASHAAWAMGVSGAIQDRQPLDLEALRNSLPARRQTRSVTPKIDLLYVISGSLPQMQSGYAHRSHGLAQALAAQGTSIICVTRPGFPADTPNFANTADVTAPMWQEVVDDVTYHRIKSPMRTKKSALEYIDAASHALEQVFVEQRPNVIMAASNHMTALPSLIAARRLGLPFIYEVRGFWEITQAGRDPAFLDSVRYDNAVKLESLAAQEADLVLTLNRPMVGELSRRGVENSNIRVLPNACAPEKFAPRARDAALAQDLGIPADMPVLGFIGSFTIYEGLDDLILACGELRRRGLDFRLVLVGDELIFNALHIPMMPRLRALIAKEGLEGHVHMPGRVPADDVPRWYSLIDIAPFPRKAMAVSELVPPLKPVEAMAMGKAIITSDVQALADFVQDEITGLMFPKGDINTFADSLEQLLRDKALRNTLGDNARSWVIAERSWSRVAPIVQEALRDLGKID